MRSINLCFVVKDVEEGCISVHGCLYTQQIMLQMNCLHGLYFSLFSYLLLFSLSNKITKHLSMIASSAPVTFGTN